MSRGGAGARKHRQHSWSIRNISGYWMCSRCPCAMKLGMKPMYFANMMAEPTTVRPPCTYWEKEGST